MSDQELLRLASEKVRDEKFKEFSRCTQIMMAIENLFSCLCWKSKQLRFVNEGYEELEDQLNLSNYLRGVKVLNTTVRSVTDHETRALLAQQTNSKFTIYDEPEHNQNKIGNGVVSSVQSVDGNIY